MVKEFRIPAGLVTAIMLIIGLLLLIKPKTSLDIICLALTIAIFVLVIINLIRYIRSCKGEKHKPIGRLVLLILCIILDIYLFIRPEAIAGFIPTVLGVFILVDGICIAISGFAYNPYLPRRGLSTFILGAILVILGAYSIIHSFEVQIFLMRFLGATLVATSLFNIGNHIMLELADARKNDATTVNFEVYKNDLADDNVIVDDKDIEVAGNAPGSPE